MLLQVLQVVCMIVCVLAKPQNFTVKDSDLNFVVLGDWGGTPFYPYYSLIEKLVAKALGEVAEEKSSRFQIGLGDNFYREGVKDVHDKRFKETFESVFTADSLQNPWYFIAGNHDWNGNVSAQIAYSQVSKRWNFPSYYYSLNFTSPDGATIDIMLLDTIILCGNTKNDDLESYPEGPVDQKLADEQLNWLQDKLKKSRADYLLVGGHFPIYSIAEHGPTDCLINKVRPLLFKYNATGYINGHDHNLQFLQESDQGVTMNYFVIGSANYVDARTTHKQDVPEGFLKFHDAGLVGGFAHFSVNKKRMSVTFLSGSDKELYNVELPPRTTNW